MLSDALDALEAFSSKVGFSAIVSVSGALETPPDTGETGESVEIEGDCSSSSLSFSTADSSRASDRSSPSCAAFSRARRDDLSGLVSETEPSLDFVADSCVDARRETVGDIGVKGKNIP